MKIKQNVCSKMWTDVNIDFRQQTIRHCCKQRGTPISLDEIDALGTDIFQKYTANLDNRHSMLSADSLPDDCGVCKDNGDAAIRHAWNIWSDEYIDAARNTLYDADLTSYIEIDISHQCDLACVYCGPWSSSAWAKELDVKHNTTDVAEIWRSRMLAATIEYIKTIDHDSQIVINFLGGEPTMIPATYDILETILPELKTFSIRPVIIFTTNMNTKPKLFERLLNIINSTADYVKYNIGVSIEDVGHRAELVRYGLDWERFNSNLERIMPIVNAVYFTCTHNLLSLPYFAETIRWIGEVTKDVDDSKWDVTANCVYDNYLDPAYLDRGVVDFDAIYAEFNAIGVKDEIVDHMKTIEARIGTRIVTDSVTKFYTDMFSRRASDDYKGAFPHITMILRDEL